MHKKIYLITIAFFPVVTLAAVTNAFDAESLVITLLGKLGYFFWLLALAVFFWGLVKFINSPGDDSEREKGKHIMIWGIIAFTVLVSLWGLVGFLLDIPGITASPLNYRDHNGTIVP